MRALDLNVICRSASISKAPSVNVCQPDFFEATLYLDVYLRRIRHWCTWSSALDCDAREPSLLHQGGGIDSHRGVGQCATDQDRW